MEWLVAFLIYLYGIVGKLDDFLLPLAIVSLVLLGGLLMIQLIVLTDYPAESFKEGGRYEWYPKWIRKLGFLVCLPSVIMYIFLPSQNTVLYMAAGFGSVKVVQEIAVNQTINDTAVNISDTAGNTMEYFNTWLTTEIRKMKVEEAEKPVDSEE